ncbi:PEP-CTERM sorting domain-containing protein [Marinimicrobium sp. C2-29]|uniref:PEP-CTERM sorting domain-containing protein n=1 Tax=Marinimicrobium sp. C2-29 TaxID=3139825 RepID=UPI003139A0B1
MNIRHSFAFGLAVFLFQLPLAAYAATVTYDGITFPDGDVSFADDYRDVVVGDPAPTAGNFDPAATIGAPDGSAYSLGQGGYVTLEFTDNSLTGSGDDSADLHIFEVGPLVEDTFVWISTDNENFISLDKVFGSTSSIDIDPYLLDAGIDPFTQFSYVRLQDDPNENTSNVTYAGADIDAVGAITSAPPVTSVPGPGSLGLIFGGLFALGARRVLRDRALDQKS